MITMAWGTHIAESGWFWLIQASDGNLCGTSGGNDIFNSATIFQITLDGAFSTLYEISV